MHKPPLTEQQIGQTIREARREQRLTQEDLAFAAGLSTGTLHNIEHGKLSARVDTLQRILSVLGMTLEIARQSAQKQEGANERGAGPMSEEQGL